MPHSQPWQVTSWDRVQLTPTQFSDVVRKFEQISTNTLGAQRNKLRCGQSLWAAPVSGPNGEVARLGIAWDWTEVRHGVVALVDPMRLLSNLLLVTEDGICIDEDETTIHLNTALYAIDWQSRAIYPHAARN